MKFVCGYQESVYLSLASNPHFFQADQQILPKCLLVSIIRPGMAGTPYLSTVDPTSNK
jgi:hypothetical protein